MQTYAPGDAPRGHPCTCGPLRAICTRQRPCLLALSLPAFAALSNCTRGAPCAHDAGRIAARRPPGRSIPPAPAPRSAPARALALPRLTARHAACKWRVAIVATASRLPGYAVPSGATPAACAPGFHPPAAACPPAPPSLRHCAPHGKPSGACGSPLATVCSPGPPAPLQAPAPARPGCRAAPARTALLVSGSPACHPSAPGGAPQKSALARRRSVDKSAFFALVAP